MGNTGMLVTKWKVKFNGSEILVKGDQTSDGSPQICKGLEGVLKNLQKSYKLLPDKVARWVNDWADMAREYAKAGTQLIHKDRNLKDLTDHKDKSIKTQANKGKEIDEMFKSEIATAEMKKQETLDELKRQETKILKPIFEKLGQVRGLFCGDDEASVIRMLKRGSKSCHKALDDSRKAEDEFCKTTKKAITECTKEINAYKKSRSLALELLMIPKVKNNQNQRNFLEPHLWMGRKAPPKPVNKLKLKRAGGARLGVKKKKS